MQGITEILKKLQKNRQEKVQKFSSYCISFSKVEGGYKNHWKMKKINGLYYEKKN